MIMGSQTAIIPWYRSYNKKGEERRRDKGGGERREEERGERGKGFWF
jgi:hypothetical protein